MPLFEYECQKCKKGFEILVYTEDEKAAVVCPYCQSKKVQSQLSTFGINAKADKSCPVPCEMGDGTSCRSNCQFH